MANKAYLVLENGKVFEGNYFGAEGEVVGEIAFTTAMTGYLETLTDPGNYGQIILQTFPLIGNYGVIKPDFESDAIQARAYIVREICDEPSNFRSEGSVDAYFKEKGITGLCGIDTRALARIIRDNGVMRGKITSAPPTDADIAQAKEHAISAPVAAVSPKEVTKHGNGSRTIAMLNFGAKRSIINSLVERDCTVWSFPYDTPAAKILEIKPDGIMLSNGPGDPVDPCNAVAIETLKELIKTDIPMFGIDLGHMLLAIAHGYQTRKMKVGHRGSNQPVKDVQTGRVYMTNQNHGFEVVADGGAFYNENDGTNEGLDYGKSFTVQFHPEACAGPLDTTFLFDRFIERVG